jgi:hypothetical protein
VASYSIFPAANEGTTLKNIDQSQRREYEEGFRKHFKVSK